MSPIEVLACRILADVLSDGTGVAGEIDAHSHFSELGVDSLTGLRFAKKLGDALDMDVEAEWLYDYPSIAELSRYLESTGANGALT